MIPNVVVVNKNLTILRLLALAIFGTVIALIFFQVDPIKEYGRSFSFKRFTLGEEGVLFVRVLCVAFEVFILWLFVYLLKSLKKRWFMELSAQGIKIPMVQSSQIVSWSEIDSIKVKTIEKKENSEIWGLTIFMMKDAIKQEVNVRLYSTDYDVLKLKKDLDLYSNRNIKLDVSRWY